MKLQYLGTAAAEGVPALFCTCPVCVFARQHGGKDMRTRFQALVDDRLLLDFPPDTYAHYLKYGFDLPEIAHLIVTHSHSDHFYPMDLEMRSPSFCHPGADVLNIYGNSAVEEGFNRVLKMEPKVALYNAFHQVSHGAVFHAGDYEVLALAALHNIKEECLFYRIQNKGKTLLFAHDTGVFPEKSWELLMGTRLDLVSLDCTCQREKDGSNHMGLADVAEVKERMLREGIADEKTVFVAAHFSHNGGWTHEKMTAEGAMYGILTAYDGMEVTV